jgi:hypothetical protein
MAYAGDAYSGGGFVYDNNGSDFSELTLSGWEYTGFGGDDSVFKASFSSAATPVPTPALLPGIVGLGMAALRKRKENQGQEATETVQS